MQWACRTFSRELSVHNSVHAQLISMWDLPLSARTGRRFLDGRDLPEKVLLQKDQECCTAKHWCHSSFGRQLCHQFQLPRALLQTLPAQAAHPLTLLGLVAIQYLRVSEGSKRFEKWAVSLSSLSSLVRKAHCLVPNTKTCHGWDFPKLLKVFGHLSLIAISKGLSGAQLTYASIHRQDHVVCRTRKVKGNCFRARIHSQ